MKFKSIEQIEALNFQQRSELKADDLKVIENTFGKVGLRAALGESPVVPRKEKSPEAPQAAEEKE